MYQRHLLDVRITSYIKVFSYIGWNGVHPLCFYLQWDISQDVFFFFNRFLSGSLEHHDCYDTQVPGIPCDLLYKACPWPTCCSCVDFMTHLFSSAQSRGHNCMLRAGYHPFGIHYMMTARHRNAPCITGHLWGESTGQQQISIQK